MLKPKDKKGGQTQQRTCEHAAGKQKKQQEKQAYYRRNPHKKWGT